MAQISKTGYSVNQGGAPGYINIGGWSTTLTARSTGPKEVIGIWRNEGINLYVYAAQGTQSAQPNQFLMFATAFTVGTENVISPIVFTSIGAAGTDNTRCNAAMAIQTCDTNTYGWYFVRGICTVQLATDTTTLSLGNLIMVATSCNAKIVPATTTAQGYVLTAIACDVSGPAFLSLMGAWH